MSFHAINRDRTGHVYRQISKTLEVEIRQRYKTGDALPSEMVLAARFGVNRHTIRHAVDLLVDAGLVERRHGSGTFVLGMIDYSIHAKSRFTEQLEGSGLSTDTEILNHIIAPASAGVARRLNLRENEDVVFIETRRRTESLITSTLPQGDDAQLLSMPLNSPVLRVKSLNVSEATGEPVEYALTRFRADRVQLSVMV